MFLYKSYCYATTQEVSDSILSTTFFTDGSFILSAVPQVTTVDVTIEPIKGNNLFYTVTPPVCDQLGFDNSFFGITPSDANELAWLCATALLLTWAVKNLKRTF